MIAVVVAVVVAGFVVVLIRPPISNPALAHELIRLARETDKPHDERVRVILQRDDWPDEREVGREGAHAAWLLVQQMQDPALLRRALELMQRAADHVSKVDLAYLTDAVAVVTGEPQTYGTVYNCENGQVVFSPPLKNPAAVDRLRREAGMDTVDHAMGGLASLTKLCAAMNEGLLRRPSDGPLTTTEVVPPR